MLTCPKCDKDMHPVCGNKECRCFKDISKNELPMNIYARFFIFGNKINFSIKLKEYDKLYRLLGGMNIVELQQCPYCGYENTYSYWEDRNMEQTFPKGIEQ